MYMYIALPCCLFDLAGFFLPSFCIVRVGAAESSVVCGSRASTDIRTVILCTHLDEWR